MDEQSLKTLFYCCIAVGLAVPLVSILLGGIGGFLDLGFDFDGIDFDSPFPVSVMGLAFGAVMFGVAGLLCVTALSAAATITVGLVAGILGQYGISRFVIRPLKRNNPQALRMEDLPGMKGTVKLELRQDFTGTIIVLSSIGSQITYSAKPIPEVEKIPVGTQVVIMDVGEDRVCIVRPEAQVQQDENAADSKRCDR